MALSALTTAIQPCLMYSRVNILQRLQRCCSDDPDGRITLCLCPHHSHAEPAHTFSSIPKTDEDGTFGDIPLSRGDPISQGGYRDGPHVLRHCAHRKSITPKLYTHHHEAQENFPRKLHSFH